MLCISNPSPLSYRKFDHANIVKILGICVDNDPVFIIMELMPAGDLLKFLREARPESVSSCLSILQCPCTARATVFGLSVFYCLALHTMKQPTKQCKATLA